MHPHGTHTVHTVHTLLTRCTNAPRAHHVALAPATCMPRGPPPGADETMTDYGFGGMRFAPQSQFGGYYPANDSELAALFP